MKRRAKFGAEPSRRETQVAIAILFGRSNAQTCADLGINLRTVETHRERLYDQIRRAQHDRSDPHADERGRGMNELRDAACTGKVKFDSFNTANKIQKRRSRDRQYRKGEVYRCQVCRGWHIGQREKEERPKHELRRFRERYQGAE